MFKFEMREGVNPLLDFFSISYGIVYDGKDEPEGKILYHLEQGISIVEEIVSQGKISSTDGIRLLVQMNDSGIVPDFETVLEKIRQKQGKSRDERPVSESLPLEQWDKTIDYLDREIFVDIVVSIEALFNGTAIDVAHGGELELAVEFIYFLLENIKVSSVKEARLMAEENIRLMNLVHKLPDKELQKMVLKSKLN